MTQTKDSNRAYRANANGQPVTPRRALSEDQVRDIFTSSDSNPSTARRHGCSCTTVSDIRHRLTLTHMTAGLERPQTCPGRQMNRPKLTEDDVRRIRASFEPVRAMARRFGVNPRTIRDAISGKNWSKVK